MKRLIPILVEVDWEDYDDVADELIIADSGLLDGIKDGVTIRTPNESDGLYVNKLGIQTFKEFLLDRFNKSDDGDWTMLDIDNHVAERTHMLNDNTLLHMGDCTKEIQPCWLCHLEDDLNEYYKHTKWKMSQRGPFG